MMNKAGFLLFQALLLASSLPALAGCGSSPDEDSDVADEEVRKRVKPKGGNGAFELGTPSFSSTGFAGAFAFDNQSLAPGDRREKVPATYWLTAGIRFDQGSTPSQQLALALTAGTVTKKSVGGLRVRAAEAITLGGIAITLAPESGSAGSLYPLGTWRGSAKGAEMLLLPGKIIVTTAADNATIEALVPEGKLYEVVLPTSRAALALDSVDPAFPTPNSCSVPVLRAGAWGNQEVAPIRKDDGTPNGPFVVPAGGRTTLQVEGYGLVTAATATSGATETITLNRLEVDDVEVTQSSGSTQLVRGTFRFAVKGRDGSVGALSNCSFPTHSGIDLPNGTYVITSTANSSSGVISYSEEVSFP